MGQCGLLQRCKESRARLPLGHHTVTTRRRLLGQCRVAIGRHYFVARVVQVHTIRRIRGLVGGHGGVKACALLFQPLQIGHAIAAEARQRRIADDAIDLMLEVSRHGFWRVFKARLLLVLGTTTGIDHAAREHAGTTAAEAVNDQHFSALLTRFNGCAGTGPTPANDDHIGGVRPLHIVRRAHIQRRAYRVDGADMFFGTARHLSSFKQPCPADVGFPVAGACPPCRPQRGRQTSLPGPVWNLPPHRLAP